MYIFKCNSIIQRKQWLSEVMASMQGNDPVKMMIQDVQVLLNGGQENIEEQAQALEDLQMYCEDIDLANGASIGSDYIKLITDIISLFRMFNRPFLLCRIHLGLDL